MKHRKVGFFLVVQNLKPRDIQKYLTRIQSYTQHLSLNKNVDASTLF
jgi:hypothetical protein